MKKLLLICILSVIFITTSIADTIRITNGEWEPYMSEYSYEYGLASHIVKEAFEMENIDIEWGFFPWKRSYELAKEGKEWDSSAVWWFSEDGKADFHFSEAVSKTSLVFFHRKGVNFDWNSVTDLNGYTVGITRGYDYGSELMQAIKKREIKTDLAVKDEQNFSKLAAKRIDLFPNDPIVGYSQLRNTLSKLEQSSITHHPKEFSVTTLHLIISRNSSRGEYFLNKFNSGLEKLKASGKLDKMMADLKAGKYDKQKTKWKK